MIHWKDLTHEGQLTDIRERSAQQPQVIFKHSTRCSISHLAKARLERSDAPVGIDFYYLDLLAYRSVSDRIAQEFQVYHESPQVILIRNGECVYDESHNGIQMDDLTEQAFMAIK